VQAETESAGDLALAQLSGALSRKLGSLEERLMDAAAEVEAHVDFAEDVGGIEIPAYVREVIAATLGELDAMLESAAWGRAVREGVRIPIVGKPNAGKSSLFNALLGEDRAIVSAEPGTTRDRVSEKLEIAGIPVTLSDTAGVREAREPVEAMGVQRSLAALDGAALVLWVVDGSQPFESAGDPLVAQLENRNVIVVLTKEDLGQVVDQSEPIRAMKADEFWAMNVSTVTGAGMIELRAAIGAQLGAGAPGGLVGAVANPRHTDALTRARTALARADEAAAAGAPGEIVALELRESLAAIGEVSGRHASEELLERIFARFCIGK